MPDTPTETAAHGRMPAVDRRRQLLDVAVDLFSRKGFSGTTTKEIAAAAGVTEAIIFRHFATKQDLYTAILDYRCKAVGSEEWLAHVKGCIDRQDDEGVFRALARKIIQVHRSDPRFERLMLYAGLEGHELATIYHRQQAIPICDMLTEYIGRRQRDGALENCHPGAILLAAAGMAQHYAMMTEMFGLEGPGFSDEEAVEAFTKILMHGIQRQAKKKARKIL